jgi:hypothetical protein
MRTQEAINTFEQLIVYQTANVGVILLVLGIFHFFNMYVIHRVGRGEPEPARPKTIIKAE